MSQHGRWVYAGTFDPITNGHLDVAARAASAIDELIIAVVDAPVHKGKGLLDTDTRVELCREATAHLPNVRVEPFAGILVQWALAHGATGLVRGLRTVTDFEYEGSICQLNRMLAPELETFYIFADPGLSFCSSSAVRELHKLGGDLSKLVPDCVRTRLAELSA